MPRARPALPPAPPPPGWRPSAAARLRALRVLADGRLSDPDGLDQRALEGGVASLCGLAPERVRACASGSAALFAALLAAGARPGREVLLPALAPAYVAGTVRLTGARPVAVEVEPDGLSPAPGAVGARAGRRVAAVVWVAPLGAAPSPAALVRALGERSPAVVEDAAQLLGERDDDGAPVGARAFAGVFSLAFGKALGVGEGGLLALAGTGAASAFAALERGAGRGTGALPRLAALGRLPPLTAALAGASLAELDERRARRRALGERLAAVASTAGVASLAAGGLPLWAGRFPSAAAARRAERRALGLRLELVPPPAWTPTGRGLAVARDSGARVRILPWWDGAAARPAEAESLVRAFACALGAPA